MRPVFEVRKALSIRRMKSAEMKMLRMICGKMMRDKVRNEEIHERTGGKHRRAIEKIVLALVCHMERMDREKPQSVAMNFKIDCLKKGRPKKRWQEVIDVDMKVRGRKRSDVVDRMLGNLAAETGLSLHVGSTNRVPGK